MKMTTLKGYYRHDVIKLLRRREAVMVGVELGVAGGAFSRRMIESSLFDYLFGVDIYADHHDTKEYIAALKHIGLFSRYKLLRLTFDEALELFPDQSFDFVYVDGYAHTGEDGGRTITSWYPKVKCGGVMAGDDYHPDWPLVVAAHEGRRLTFVPGFNDWDFDIPFLYGGMTGTFATWCACYMTAGPVLLCGMDCFQSDRVYFHSDPDEHHPCQDSPVEHHLDAWRPCLTECRHPERIRAMSGPLGALFGCFLCCNGINNGFSIQQK